MPRRLKTRSRPVGVWGGDSTFSGEGGAAAMGANRGGGGRGGRSSRPAHWCGGRCATRGRSRAAPPGRRAGPRGRARRPHRGRAARRVGGRWRQGGGERWSGRSGTGGGPVCFGKERVRTCSHKGCVRECCVRECCVRECECCMRERLLGSRPEEGGGWRRILQLTSVPASLRSPCMSLWREGGSEAVMPLPEEGVAGRPPEHAKVHAHTTSKHTRTARGSRAASTHGSARMKVGRAATRG